MRLKHLTEKVYMKDPLPFSDTHHMNPSMIRSTQKKREAWKNLISEWEKKARSVNASFAKIEV